MLASTVSSWYDVFAAKFRAEQGTQLAAHVRRTGLFVDRWIVDRATPACFVVFTWAFPFVQGDKPASMESGDCGRLHAHVGGSSTPGPVLESFCLAASQRAEFFILICGAER